MTRRILSPVGLEAYRLRRSPYPGQRPPEMGKVKALDLTYDSRIRLLYYRSHYGLQPLSRPLSSKVEGRSAACVLEGYERDDAREAARKKALAEKKAVADAKADRRRALQEASSRGQETPSSAVMAQKDNPSMPG